MEIFPTIPPKLLSVCTETQLNSLSLITPREGQNTQIKHGHFVFLEASGLNGSQNKIDSFLAKVCGLAPSPNCGVQHPKLQLF